MTQWQATPATGSRLTGWRVVGVLTVISVLNYVDRSLPAILAEDIKRDLHLSDTMLGAVLGFGFLVTYALVGIPIARLADRGRYGAIIGAAVTLWSVMTILGGWAQTGWMFALSRMGVAIGEAGSTPASHAYLSRHFSPRTRTTAIAILSTANPIGQFVALAGGGYIATHFGWRTAMTAIGTVGLLLAALPVLLLGSAADAGSSQSLEPARADWRVFRQPACLCIFAAQAFIAAGAYAFVSFGPAFLIRVHGMSVAEVGRSFGLMTGILGTAGVILLGRAADVLSRRDARWLLRIPTLSLTAAVPSACLAFTLADPRAVLACYGWIMLSAAATLAPTISALHRIVPPHVRAQASSLVLFSSAIFGGVGPFIVGLLSDRLQPLAGRAALGEALLLVVPMMIGLSAGCYLLAERTIASALDATTSDGGYERDQPPQTHAPARSERQAREKAEIDRTRR